MKKLLWVGDAGCESGFARATHETLNAFRGRYDITVLGVNYRGDPHPYPYPIYAAMPGGDWAGVGRIVYMCDVVKPDVIVLQNDPWNIPQYTKQLALFSEYASIPLVGSVAIDALNCRGTNLNSLTHTIFWTKFAEDQARAGGFTGTSSVIPLGVDTDIYFPSNRQKARERLFPADSLSKLRQQPFIVGVVGRNQPRKRLDLTVAYFAKWVKTYDVQNAYLYLHVGPTADEGYDLVSLASYYGILDRLIISAPPAWQGVSEEVMVDTYRSFDVFFSTTLGEGMGLPALEAMACGIPCVLPAWSAYAEWALNAAMLVPCSNTMVTCVTESSIGGVMDEGAAVQALRQMYSDSSQRATWANKGHQRSRENRFRWSTIGEAFCNVVTDVLEAQVARI